MREASDSFKPLFWYAITQGSGIKYGSADRSSCITSEAQYYVLEAEESIKAAGMGSQYFWLRTYVLYNATFTECNLSGNGVEGVFLRYEKYGPAGNSYLHFKFTDQVGNISFKSFTGEISAFPKAIKHMYELSQDSEWKRQELEAQKLEIRRLRNVVQKLMDENKQLKLKLKLK